MFVKVVAAVAIASGIVVGAAGGALAAPEVVTPAQAANVDNDPTVAVAPDEDAVSLVAGAYKKLGKG